MWELSYHYLYAFLCFLKTQAMESNVICLAICSNTFNDKFMQPIADAMSLIGRILPALPFLFLEWASQTLSDGELYVVKSC